MKKHKNFPEKPLAKAKHRCYNTNVSVDDWKERGAPLSFSNGFLTKTQDVYICFTDGFYVGDDAYIVPRADVGIRPYEIY